MAYNTYNNGFPITYTPVVPNYAPYSYQPMQYVQPYSPYGQPYQQHTQAVQGTQQAQQMQQPNQTQNNSSIQPQANQFSNQYSSAQLPIQSNQSNHNMNTNDIVWIQEEQEVFNYPVAQDSCVMFISMNQMKMYTKEGSTGLIRDFDLHESPESIQRYQQLQQTMNMQFPVVDTQAMEVDTEAQAEQIVNTIEKKLEERFNDLEQKFCEMTQNVNNANATNTNTVEKVTPKTMTKRGGK